MPHKTTTYHRSTLYEEVWTNPVQTVAKRYGVSDVALAKVCRKLSVPLPPRGHWARVAAGRKVARPPLPKPKPGAPNELTTSRRVDDVAPRLAIEIETERKITVPDELTKPHRLVASARAILRRSKVRDYGRYGRPAETCLHIEVAPASLERALRLLDTLLKEAELRGYRAEVTPYAHASTQRVGDPLPSNESRIIVDEVPIRFRLREKSSAGERASEAKHELRALVHGPEWALNYRSRSDFVANGKFELTMSNGYPDVVWSDSARRPLETRLNDIFVKLSLMAREKQERDAAERHRQAEAQAAAARRWTDQRRAEAEQQRIGTLKATIEQWRLARDIRAYVDAITRTVDLTADLESDIAWALAYADRIDPIASLARRRSEEVREDDVLDDEEDE